MVSAPSVTCGRTDKRLGVQKAQFSFLKMSAHLLLFTSELSLTTNKALPFRPLISVPRSIAIQITDHRWRMSVCCLNQCWNVVDVSITHTFFKKRWLVETIIPAFHVDSDGASSILVLDLVCVDVCPVFVCSVVSEPATSIVVFEPLMSWSLRNALEDSSARKRGGNVVYALYAYARAVILHHLWRTLHWNTWMRLVALQCSLRIWCLTGVWRSREHCLLPLVMVKHHSEFNNEASA